MSDEENESSPSKPIDSGEEKPKPKRRAPVRRKKPAAPKPRRQKNRLQEIQRLLRSQKKWLQRYPPQLFKSPSHPNLSKRAKNLSPNPNLSRNLQLSP